MSMKPICRILSAIVTAMFLAAAPANAAPFVISLDTSPITGTWTLGFVLVSGDANVNTVTLSDFDFGVGGSADAGTEFCDGNNCSGSLDSGVTLQDLDFAVLFLQQFTAGSSLSFQLASTNLFAGPTPDQLSIFLCDATTCYSDDGTGALLLLDLTGGVLTTANFSLFDASAIELDAPSVTAVPEPGSVLLLGTALAFVARHRRLRR